MIIERRFNGPAGTGNGGYTAGLVAAHLPRPALSVEVTLRVPPPLETPLRVQVTADGGVRVYAGELLVAEATPADSFDEEPVPPVGYPEAVTAAAAYPGFLDHPFPTCFVCGPDRAPGDGLRIFPGPLPDGDRTAAPWRVPDDVTVATVWAALDCPGGWAIIRPGRPYVLGRIAAVVETVPVPGAECVVVGAAVAAEGRKAGVRTALYQRDAPERPLAHARATWIAI